MRGFGNCVGAIEGYQTLTERPNCQGNVARATENLEGIHKTFLRLNDGYSKLPLGEVRTALAEGADEQDRTDFETFFLVANILPRLDITIKDYTKYCRENNFSVTSDCAVSKRLTEAIESIKRAEKYRGIHLSDRVNRLKRELEGEGK